MFDVMKVILNVTTAQQCLVLCPVNLVPGSELHYRKGKRA